MLSARKGEIQDENATVLRSRRGIPGLGDQTVDKPTLRSARTPGTQRKALGNISNVLPTNELRKTSLTHDSILPGSSLVKPSVGHKTPVSSTDAYSVTKESPLAGVPEEEFDIVSLVVPPNYQ